MADFSEQWEGRTIDGGFPLRRFLNGGDRSAVFLTTYENRDAAIKLLSVDAQEADDQLAQWRVAQKLVHPHLIRIFEMGRSELDGVPLVYIVMETAEEDLSQVLPDRSLTAVEAREMLEPTLSALEYIHQQGFVHGHLKPANIMAVEDSLKIASDGISKAGSNKTANPGPYDPPERGVSAPGDMWALGVTLVEVLTQKLPVSTPRFSLPTDLPEPFAEIARHCLVTNPAERWTPSQISRHLNQREAAVVSVPQTPGRKRMPVGVMVLLAAVLLVVGGVIIRQYQAELPAAASSKESAKAPEVVAKPETKPETAAEPEKPQEIAKEIETPAKQLEGKPVESKPAEPPAAADESKPSVDLRSGEIADQPMPEIPASARRTIHGKVTVNVKVDVDATGSVRDVKLDSPAASKYFTSRTIDAVQRWKFKPISVNGSDSAQRWRVHFEFQTSGTKVQPKRISP